MIIIIIPITLKIIIIVLMIFCLGARSTGSPAFSEPQWWTVSPPPGLWQVWWPPIQVSLLHSGGAAEFDGLWRILCTGFAFVFFPDQRFLDPSTDVEIETDVTFLFCHAGAMIIAFREVMIQLRSLKSLGGETQMGWEKTFKNMIKHGKLGKIMEDNEKIWQHDKGHKTCQFENLTVCENCGSNFSVSALGWYPARVCNVKGRFVQSLWADPSHVILKENQDSSDLLFLLGQNIFKWMNFKWQGLTEGKVGQGLAHQTSSNKWEQMAGSHRKAGLHRRQGLAH